MTISRRQLLGLSAGAGLIAATLPIPGTTKPHHAKENLGAAFGRLPDDVLRREIENYISPLL